MAATTCHHRERKVCGLKVKVGHRWVFPPTAPLKLAKRTLETLQRSPQTLASNHHKAGKYVKGLRAQQSLSDRQQPSARRAWKVAYLKEL